MIIKVKAFGGFREVLGKAVEIELDESATVEVLLVTLCSSRNSLKDMIFGKSGEILGDVNILKNGRHIQSLEGIVTQLSDDDEIAIFPTVVGG
jgi:MoaD family protein